MPAAFAASITRVPGAACTSRPSIVSLTKSAIQNLFHRRHAEAPVKEKSHAHQTAGAFIRARFAIQVIFELVAELLDDGDGRHRRRVSQRTKRPSQHVLGEIADEIDVAARPAALVETREDLFQPGRALTAGDAPAAALVRVELHDA